VADWNFDLSAAPKGEWTETVEKGGRSGERLTRRYSAPRVIIASKCGKVITTRWLPPDEKEKRPNGRWEFFNADEEIAAWQAYPVHPHEMKDEND
jgi:hypothetical protein